MHNPYKSPAYEEDDSSSGALQINALLLLLAIIATWMLTKDIQHLLKIYSGSLKNAAGISIFHYAYIKIAPLEIAYFRIFSSAAILALIIATARNSKYFIRNHLPFIAYGATQLIYQALAISGITAILTKTAGRSIIEASFWLAPEMVSSTIQLLLEFLIILAPPLLFLAICLITKSLISRTKAVT